MVANATLLYVHVPVSDNAEQTIREVLDNCNFSVPHSVNFLDYIRLVFRSIFSRHLFCDFYD